MGLSGPIMSFFDLILSYLIIFMIYISYYISLGLPTSVTLWLSGCSSRFHLLERYFILRNKQISEHERLFMSALWTITLCRFGGLRKVRTTSAKSGKSTQAESLLFSETTDRPSLKSLERFFLSRVSLFGRLRYI